MIYDLRRSAIVAMMLIVAAAIGSLESFAVEPSAAAAAQVTAPAVQPPSMAAMQARMQEMQAQMARIHQTKDAAERQRLMQAHMASMSQMMQNLHQMCATQEQPGGCTIDGSTMMGPGVMQGGMMQQGSTSNATPAPGNPAQAASPDTAARLAAIEQRLDLLTQMLDQVIQHQGAATKPPRK
jgi:hypothetical protein